MDLHRLARALAVLARDTGSRKLLVVPVAQPGEEEIVCRCAASVKLQHVLYAGDSLASVAFAFFYLYDVFGTLGIANKDHLQESFII